MMDPSSKNSGGLPTARPNPTPEEDTHDTSDTAPRSERVSLQRKLLHRLRLCGAWLGNFLSDFRSDSPGKQVAQTYYVIGIFALAGSALIAAFQLIIPSRGPATAPKPGVVLQGESSTLPVEEVRRIVLDVFRQKLEQAPGQIDREVNRLMAVVSELRELQRTDPSRYFEIEAAIGALLRGDTSKAIDVMRREIQTKADLFPADSRQLADLHYHLASLLITNDLEGAADAARIAIRYDPQHKNALQTLADASDRAKSSIPPRVVAIETAALDGPPGEAAEPWPRRVKTVRIPGPADLTNPSPKIIATPSKQDVALQASKKALPSASKPAGTTTAPTEVAAAVPKGPSNPSLSAASPTKTARAPTEVAAAAATSDLPSGTYDGPAPNFRWPVRGRLIAGFGKIDERSNDGINVAVVEGTPIVAAADGIVAYAGNELKSYGNLVLIRHSGGFVTAYAHASVLLVKRGDQVKSGQIVARSGRTGNVTSPQLHFEIRNGPTPVDPIRYLPKR